MIRFKQKGDFSKLTNYLEKSLEKYNLGILNKYGKKGVELLAEATPKRTGLTAASWKYEVENKLFSTLGSSRLIENKEGVAKIIFSNTNIQNGVNIALILQYGHGTSRGGWVQGRDYINPVIQPLFDELVNETINELKSVK